MNGYDVLGFIMIGLALAGFVAMLFVHPHRGYRAGPRTADELRQPPKGPAPGSKR